jgi:hypothetical protein
MSDDQQGAAIRRVKDLAERWAAAGLVDSVFARELYHALAVHKGDPPLAGPTLGYMVLNREKPDDMWDGSIHPWEKAVDELSQARADSGQFGTGWYLAEIRLVQP